jgi:hypothetical protein
VIEVLRDALYLSGLVSVALAISVTIWGLANALGDRQDRHQLIAALTLIVTGAIMVVAGEILGAM